MFEFISHQHNLHNAIYAFDRIIQLQQVSGLKPQLFFNNILKQVMQDGGEYENGTSYNQLNDISAGLRTDFEAVLKEAAEYKDISRMQELIAKLETPEDIFSSWKMLNQYKELCELLDKKEILDGLQNEHNPKLQNYIATLLFHPSVSNTNAVKMLWQNPYIFFGLESSYTSQELHDNKKTQNYVEIPHLDLSAEELRDALVEGALDKIQVWTPLEVTYVLPINEVDKDLFNEISEADLQTLMKRAFGYKKEGFNGDIDKGRRKKVAMKLKEVLPEGMTMRDLIIENIPLPQKIEKKLRVLLYKEGYRRKVEKFKMKVNLKSDPDGVVAGDDTGSCMPFGDGKNTLYTYNPICALMTLQRETYEGKWRTIAQSVLTKDKDVHVNVAEIVEMMESGDVHIQDFANEDLLENEESVIACDSVEVNPNAQQYEQTIKELYAHFLGKYADLYAEADNLNAEKVVIGTQNGHELPSMQSGNNTYIPLSPVAYSDKTEKEVYVLALNSGGSSGLMVDEERVAPKEECKNEEIRTPNVDFLTFEDTLQTAFIEGKAYDNKSLKEGLHNMENSLIAKDINNAAKGRPNMSFKYTDDEGRMGGYLLAYEGDYNVRTYEDDYDYEDDYEYEQPGEHGIYVQDFARLPSQKEAGTRILQEFLRQYKLNYLDKENKLPIFAELREQSSYKVVKRVLSGMKDKTGFGFKLEEGEPYMVGDDKMIPVALRPI